MADRKRRAGAFARVYDGLPSHPKVVSIPRSGDLRALAMGTWVLCLSWANDHLSDGYVPAPIVEEVGGTLAGAEALVASKLWRRRAGGFQFVNYSESQTTRTEVETLRADAAERQRRSRKNRGVGHAHVTSDKRVSDTQSSSSSEPQAEVTGLIPPDVIRSQPSRARGSSPQPDPQVDNFDLDAVSNALLAVAPALDLSAGPEQLHGRAVIAARTILGRKRGPAPADPTAYIVRSIERDASGWQQFAYDGSVPA